jgi:DNA-binding NtrC family response regulator
LRAYTWPGNVRELENALTRAVVLATSSVLEASLLPIGRAIEAPAPSPNTFLPLREVEKMHISGVLAHTAWNKRRACAMLEISRPTLDRKIEEYALSREDRTR